MVTANACGYNGTGYAVAKMVSMPSGTEAFVVIVSVHGPELGGEIIDFMVTALVYTAWPARVRNTKVCALAYATTFCVRNVEIFASFVKALAAGQPSYFSPELAMHCMPLS